MLIGGGILYLIPSGYLSYDFNNFRDRLAPITALAGFVLLGASLASFAEAPTHTLERELEPIRAERERLQGDTGTGELDAFRRLELNLNQIAEYYTINKSQARNSFRFGVFAVTAGMATLVVSVAVYLSDKSGHVTPAAITGISGVLVEFIGGSALYLYNKSLGLLNLFYERLADLQEVMLAVVLSDQIEDPSRKDEIRMQLIRSLFRRPVAAPADLPVPATDRGPAS